MSQGMVETWSHLPAELRSLNQWCIAGPDRAPYLPTSTGTIVHASPTKGPWMDFQTACNWATHLGVGIGYVITASDPFACIDLDIKDSSSLQKDGTPYPPEKYTTQNSLAMYQDIVSAFDSYTELSASGKGLHIWVNGAIGQGARRGGVEIYSQERFIVCTGKEVYQVKYDITEQGLIIPGVINNHSRLISARADLLALLVKDIKVDVAPSVTLEEMGEEKTDAQIWEMARSAANRDKFVELCEGDFVKMGYETHSHADLALLSMFTFYSKSNEQCRRMFRQTVLGNRDKSTQDNRYIDLTLGVIRSRQAKAAQATELIKEQAKGLLTQIVAPAAANPQSNSENEQHLRDEDYIVNDIPWPPGKMGELAQFIYHSSPRPVKEVAILTALGFMAGICGKAFIVSDTGLNMYLVLVARSGIGKETMHNGISLLVNKLQEGSPGLKEFVVNQTFLSGSALMKVIAENQCFLNINGEWGKRLKTMAKDVNGTNSVSGVRTVMTDLYGKSGPTSIVGGLSYSDKDKSTSSVSGVAFSMIGESTPGVFYNSLTDEMMEDGFMSRFTVIEYEGDRPEIYKERTDIIPEEMLLWLKAIISQALILIDATKCQNVLFDKEAEIEADQFDKYCDNKIRGQEDESIRQMYNRAHLKVLKLAALLAVTNNYITPIVTPVEFRWAANVIWTDINRMRRKAACGDIGSSDNSRIQKVKNIIKEYFTKNIPKSYNIDPRMKKDAIIPMRYIHTRITSVAIFGNHPYKGHTMLLRETLSALVDMGVVTEVPKIEVQAAYNFKGVCYRISSELD